MVGEPTQTSAAGGAPRDDPPRASRRTAAPRGPGKRGVSKQFRWRLGHEPDYAEPSSGWQYIRWEVSEGPETVPNQTHDLGGGPEAFPCDCGEMFRIVARKQAKEIIEGSEVIRLREDYDEAKLNVDEVYLLICPKCRTRLQFRGSILKRLVFEKTGRIM